MTCSHVTVTLSDGTSHSDVPILCTCYGFHSSSCTGSKPQSSSQRFDSSQILVRMTRFHQQISSISSISSCNTKILIWQQQHQGQKSSCGRLEVWCLSPLGHDDQ